MRVEADVALRSALDDACQSGGVAGAALAVLADGVLRTAEVGVASAATAEPGTFVQEPSDTDYPVVSFVGDFASVAWFGYRREAQAVS